MAAVRVLEYIARSESKANLLPSAQRLSRLRSLRSTTTRSGATQAVAPRLLETGRAFWLSQVQRKILWSISNTFRLANATTGLAATTNRQVTIENDVFTHNEIAVNISASYDLLTLSGTNAAIHKTWFDENGVALDGSSDWDPVEPCCTRR